MLKVYLLEKVAAMRGEKRLTPPSRAEVARFDTHPGLLCCALSRGGRMAVAHKSTPRRKPG